MTIQRLRELIQTTHEHGLRLKREIRVLETRGPISHARARVLRGILKGLEALNRHRRRELAEKEHPHPSPSPPKPKPQRFTMYDTVTVATVPNWATAVAGYVGGKWPTYNELVKRFPNAKHLSIAVNSGENAVCLDVETGDATPAEAPAWVKRQKARGVQKPVLYANASTMPAVEEALRNAGIHRWEYRTWVAHYTNVPHIEPGADACQFTDVALGRNLDASLCEPWFL